MTDELPRCAVVGAGRLGTTIAAAMPADGPYGRGFRGTDPTGLGYDVVLLCVPDDQIAAAAALVEPGPLVGHCAGAYGPEVVAPHEGFVLHPLMTFPTAGAVLTGVGCTITASTPAAQRVAGTLAAALGMRPADLADADRSLYHAAASIASNYLVTVEACAERLLAGAGLERELLVPLVRATVENWARHGSAAALTGPVARGDEGTVARQRAAVAERTPDALPLFDALTDATRALAEPR